MKAARSPTGPLLALVATLGCAGTPSPQATSPPTGASTGSRPETSVRRAATARPSAPPAASAPPASTGSSETDEAPGGDAAPAASSPIPARDPLQLLVERPHPLHRRPRAEGRIQASTDDEALARWNVGGCSNPAYRSNRRGFHPAPRVVIDTVVIDAFVPEHSRKTLSRRRILSRCRDGGYWSTRICYEQLLRASDPDAAEVRMRMDIGANGRVRRTVLQDVETGAPAQEADLVACLADGLGAIDFAPRPGRRVRVDVRMRLWPGDAPLPSLPEPPASKDGGDAAPSAETEFPRARALRRERREAIRTQLEALEPTVSECFDRGRARDPRLWGRLAVALTFDARGHVRAASQHESHFPDPDVVSCVLEVLRTTTIPASSQSDDGWVVAFRLDAAADPSE